MFTSGRPLNGKVGPTPTRPSEFVNLAPSNGSACVKGFSVKPNRNSLIRLGLRFQFQETTIILYLSVRFSEGTANCCGLAKPLLFQVQRPKRDMFDDK